LIFPLGRCEPPHRQLASDLSFDRTARPEESNSRIKAACANLFCDTVVLARPDIHMHVALSPPEGCQRGWHNIVEKILG
jgi:hypothetical protein